MLYSTTLNINKKDEVNLQYMAYTVSGNTEFITYKVQNGDTYASIAKMYNTTISDLVLLNDLDEFDLNMIFVGSILKVGLRDATSGKVIPTGIKTDDDIEKTFIEASQQSISVDTVTQSKLESIKEKYRQTGSLDSITNELNYLTSDKGYTPDEVKLLLNEADVGLDAADRIQLNNYLNANNNSNGIGNTLNNIGNAVGNTLNNIGNSVGNTLNNIGNAVNAGLTGVSNALSNVLGNNSNNSNNSDDNGSSKGGSYDDSDFSKDTILGLPFRYNTYADPRRRVYNSTFLTDAPIVSIMPGKPSFRGGKESSNDPVQSLIDKLFGTEDSDSILDLTENEGYNDYNDDYVLGWLKESQKNYSAKTGDLRYYRFKEDYDNFEKYLDINLSTLAVKMGIGELGSARYKDFMNRNADKDAFLGIGRTFKFYCTKNTSSSESISNEFGDSQIAGAANSVSEAVQEFNFVTQGILKDELYNAAGTVGKAFDNIIKTVFNTLNGSEEEKDFGLKFGALAQAAAEGNKIIWPQIWKNSTFSRSYSLSFEFVSPYGSPEAIFRNVYLPFVTLLTLAMPKQFGVDGYSNPFLIRIDMPGSFTSDFAVIQSMSWRKGGNEGLYSNDGLPLAITVDITVQDLYPNMVMSDTWAKLRHNTGMHSFLDNMAGLTVERFTPWENIKNSLAIRSVNVLGNVERATLGQLKTKVYSIGKDTLGRFFGTSTDQ